MASFYPRKGERVLIWFFSMDINRNENIKRVIILFVYSQNVHYRDHSFATIKYLVVSAE